MKTLEMNKLFLGTIALTALGFTLSGGYVEAANLKGKFNFKGNSTYCDTELEMMASLMIVKEKNAQGKEMLIPEKSTVQFSITKEEADKCKRPTGGAWESRPMKVTEGEFDDDWNLKWFKFIGFAEKGFDQKKHDEVKMKWQKEVEGDPNAMPPIPPNPDALPPIGQYRQFAYMTGFFDFMMTQKGITYYLLDRNFNEFGSTPPMILDPSDPMAMDTLDPGDFNKPNEQPNPGKPSDTTTIMGLPNKAELKHIPEPNSTLSFLALGTLGATSALKRKLKPSKSSDQETTKIG